MHSSGKHIKVGTRGSKLALAQTQTVISKLQLFYPEVTFEMVTITVSGEILKDRPITEIGSTGVFVKELEEALLKKEVDFVVHSLKDLPTNLPPDLVLACVCDREDPHDVLISRDQLRFSQLPAGARVATSSRRRIAQLLALRKDLTFVDIRGNIDTRLRKLGEGQCDAIVLAAAGMKRLSLLNHTHELLDLAICLPAVGQGVLAVECRKDSREILAMLAKIEDTKVRWAITAERSFLDHLGGGCSVPVGALAAVEVDPNDARTGNIRLFACVAALDGSQVIRYEITAPANEAERLGKSAAEWMLANGAEPILQVLRCSTPNTISPP